MTDSFNTRPQGPVSGLYRGRMTSPDSDNYELELRLDIDEFYPHAVVTNRISGDLFQIFEQTTDWKVYQASWLVDKPQVVWHDGQVTISGDVIYWRGEHPSMSIDIVIPWNEESGELESANVAFLTDGATTANYRCRKQSDFLRHVRLEVDVCKSVNSGAIVPSFDTGTVTDAPSDLARRTITIQDAFHEAGIGLEINPERSVIDDTGLPDTNWLPSELHDAMETYFSEIKGKWPKWQVWTLLASGVYEDPQRGTQSTVAGIMFDFSQSLGGGGDGPERQGAAIFRKHRNFDNLVAGVPQSEAQVESQRFFLYTYVHEIGHAFNMLHSWNKQRPDALSWMNYPQRYDGRDGRASGAFWKDFRFRFDDEELMHLRHGNRSAVIMGGDPISLTSSALDTSWDSASSFEGKMPLELLLRSKPYFEFMEPVNVEFRLRNLTNQPQAIDVQMQPEFGTTAVFIRRPDGLVMHYHPVFCKLAVPDVRTLSPLRDGVKGEDRHSETLMLSYGGEGYYFDKPGEYQVWAIYRGIGNVMIPSNIHRIRIGHPFSRDEDRAAQDFFSQDTGMSLYFNGSASLHLRNGMKVIEEMAEQFKDTPLGAQLSLVVADQFARDTHRLTKEGKRIRQRKADPEAALDLMQRALDQNQQQEEDVGETALDNITYHQVRRRRADLLAEMGDTDAAKAELDSLVDELRAKGVNQPVLEDIEAHASEITGEA